MFALLHSGYRLSNSECRIHEGLHTGEKISAFIVSFHVCKVCDLTTKSSVVSSDWTISDCIKSSKCLLHGGGLSEVQLRIWLCAKRLFLVHNSLGHTVQRCSGVSSSRSQSLHLDLGSASAHFPRFPVGMTVL